MPRTASACPSNTPSTDVTRRVLEEYKAGRYVADTIFLNMGGLRIMRDAGALIPFYTPEAAAYGRDAKESGDYWIAAWESYVGLAFNTKQVKAEEAPMTYDDMLDPKWMGRMSVSSRSSTLNNWIGAIVLSKGEDYLRKLGKQDITVYKISGRALSNLVVSGEVPISPAVYQAHMISSAKKGATVVWRAPGTVYAGAGGGAIAAKPPHPHAAMLLADFFLSKEGQAMRQNIGDQSARLDLVTPDKPKQIMYLTDRPNYNQEFEHWGKLARTIFGPAKDRKK